MGRSVKPKPTFTFSSGETVTLERVGPLFALPIQRANPPPPPPLALGVGGVMEPNPADPDYEKTLADHSLKVNLLVQDLALNLGISEHLPGYDQDAVDRIKRGYEAIGITLTETDRMIYIKYVCITSESDMERFFDALRNYDVTEEAIAAAGETFPGISVGSVIGNGDAPVAEIPAAV